MVETDGRRCESRAETDLERHLTGKGSSLVSRPPVPLWNWDLSRQTCLYVLTTRKGLLTLPGSNN